MDSRFSTSRVGAQRRGWVAAFAASAMIAAGMAAAPPASAASGTFSQTSGIAINDSSAGGSNATPITITDNAAATPYPSDIAVAGHAGSITDVNVFVSGINHTFPDDIDMLLVGPSGHRVVLMSDVGDDPNLVDVNLGFDDQAATGLPDASLITSDTYQPTNVDDGVDAWPAPAPDAAGAGSSLSAFNGDSANGTWSLYIVDDNPVDSGSIDFGWSLDISTTNPAAATPYPSTLSVSGALNGITDVNVGLKSFDHTFPADVDVLVVGPGGQKAIILSNTGGFAGVVNADLVFDDQAAAPPTSPIVSGTFQPVNSGAGDLFPAPAPDATAAGSALSVFNGTNPNGVWQLFVMDDAGGDAGDISGGWTLQITTGDSPAAPVISAPATGTRDRDGAIAFVGTSGAGSTVKLTEGGVLKGTVVASPAGGWALGLVAVANGAHTYTATSTDAALNVSAPSTAVTVIVDKTAPTVRSTTPKNNKKRVKPKTNVTVTFSEAVRSGTLVKADVFLTKAGSSKKVKAKLHYSSTTHQLVLNPTHTLAGGTKYRITVTSKVLDLAGNPLDQSSTKKGAQAKTATFRTR